MWDATLNQRYLAPPPVTRPRWRVISFPDTLSHESAIWELIAVLFYASVWDGEHADEAAGLMRDMFTMRTMAGEIFMSVSETAPAGSLPCDGNLYARDDYPELWEVTPAHMKNLHGFYTPDMRDRSPAGAHTHPTGEHYGVATHTLTSGEMPNHSHETIPHSHAFTYVGSIVVPDAAGLIPEPTGFPSPMAGTTAPAGVTVLSAGGGLAHNNIPPRTAVNFYIRT